MTQNEVFSEFDSGGRVLTNGVAGRGFRPVVTALFAGQRSEGFMTDMNRENPLIRPVGHLLPLPGEKGHRLTAKVLSGRKDLLGRSLIFSIVAHWF